MAASLVELLLLRSKSQNDMDGLGGYTAGFNETNLPPLLKVRNWSVSGTGQWSKGQLRCLKKMPIEELATYLKDMGTWRQVMGIAELLVHGEEERARKVAQATGELTNPQNETYADFFGEEIAAALLGLNQTNE